MGQIKNIKLHIVTDIKKMMNVSGKRQRKQRKGRKVEHDYLLTLKKTWVHDKVLPSMYSSLVDTYNDNLQVEQKVIKVEPVSCSVADVKVENQTFLPLSTFMEEQTLTKDVAGVVDEDIS